MNQEIYVFGSMTRGEVSPTSDTDILVVQNDPDQAQCPASWSVYSRDTVKSYFAAGRLFAWHLHLEAVQIYPRGEHGLLAQLGQPAPYLTMAEDLSDLINLLGDAARELQADSPSSIYELGLVYTAVRDIAMTASWALLDRPSFSRYVPYELPVRCPIPRDLYEIAMQARHASTRGTREPEDFERAAKFMNAAFLIDWADFVRSQACQTLS